MNMYAIGQYGYQILFINILLESFGFPLPGEITLIAASVLAGEGELEITAVLALSFAAAVIGDNIGYVIGRLGGRRALLRFGKYVLLSGRRLEKLEGLFTRYGQGIVLAARFVSGLRQLNGVIAGTLAMPWKKFLLFNAAGAALWVAGWGMLSYTLGRHARGVHEVFHRYEIATAAFLAAAAALFLVRGAVRRIKGGRP